jgi:hypothetical protein
MTVSRRDEAMIVIADECPVDDVENLLQLLLETPTARVDWSRCAKVHTAIIQVLLASKAAVIGEPQDAFLRTMIRPLFQ